MAKFKITQADLNNIDDFVEEVEAGEFEKTTHKPKFDDEANIVQIGKKKTKVRSWTRPVEETEDVDFTYSIGH